MSCDSVVGVARGGMHHVCVVGMARWLGEGCDCVQWVWLGEGCVCVVGVVYDLLL